MTKTTRSVANPARNSDCEATIFSAVAATLPGTMRPWRTKNSPKGASSATISQMTPAHLRVNLRRRADGVGWRVNSRGGAECCRAAPGRSRCLQLVHHVHLLFCGGSHDISVVVR